MANIEVIEAKVTSAPASVTGGSDRQAALALGLVAMVLQGGDDGEFARLKGQLRELATRDPIDSLLLTVLGGGLLFYTLEKDSNPRCATYWDAVLYAATSLSVGYDDVFPKTSGGNAVAALMQTFGPALAAAAFAPPSAVTTGVAEGAARSDAELLAVNKAILERLDEIAASLKRSESQ